MRSILRAKGERIYKNRKQRRVNRESWHHQFSFEQFEPRIVLANTDTTGTFSIPLDNAPGEINGFDGNLALYQSGLVYNSRTVSDLIVQFRVPLPADSGGNKPTSVSGTFSFPAVGNQLHSWQIDTLAQVGDEMLFRFPVSFDTLPTGRYNWSFAATWSYASGSQPVVYTGTSFYVSRAGSEFGDGWYLDDLHELRLFSPRSSGGQVWLLFGHGETTRFNFTGSVYEREPGDQYFFKLERVVLRDF